MQINQGGKNQMSFGVDGISQCAPLPSLCPCGPARAVPPARRVWRASAGRPL